MKKFIIFICALTLFMPFTKAQTINHSYADIGSDINFKDDVNGTSALAGDNIESSGNILGINFLAGNNIEVKGQSDYLAVAGNIISVKGTILNDGFIAGNIVDLKEKGLINRDVIIAASDVEISGTIGRNATIYAANVDFKSANIKGNVKIYAEKINIDSETTINGSLSYPKDASAKINTNINKIIKTDPLFTEEKETFLDIAVNKVWSIMSLILIFALLTLLVPKLFNKINTKYSKMDFNKIIEIFSKGLVFMIITPALSIFLLMLPFAIPLSLIILALYIIIIYISKLFTAYLIGYKLWKKYIQKDINVLLSGLIGFGILFILDFIPIISGISLLISIIFGIGVICDTTLRKKKS